MESKTRALKFLYLSRSLRVVVQHLLPTCFHYLRPPCWKIAMWQNAKRLGRLQVCNTSRHVSPRKGLGKLGMEVIYTSRNNISFIRHQVSPLSYGKGLFLKIQWVIVHKWFTEAQNNLKDVSKIHWPPEIFQGHRIIQGMDSWLTYLRFNYATSAHLLHFTSS